MKSQPWNDRDPGSCAGIQEIHKSTHVSMHLGGGIGGDDFEADRDALRTVKDNALTAHVQQSGHILRKRARKCV